MSGLMASSLGRGCWLDRRPAQISLADVTLHVHHHTRAVRVCQREDGQRRKKALPVLRMPATLPAMPAEQETLASLSQTPRTHRVEALFSHGRLVAIPRKEARREQLLVHLADTLFERERSYSEREVNEALLTVHEDCSALRRYLVVAGLLVRPRDGSTYRRGR